MTSNISTRQAANPCIAAGDTCATCFTVCFNMTNQVECGYEYEHVRFVDLLLGALLVPILLATVIIGWLFLSIMWRLRSKRVASHVFMISLVVADIICALFCMPVTLAILFNSRELRNVLAQYVQGLLMITIRQVTMFTILVMIIDKMVAVSRPLNYKNWFTYKTTTLITVILWVISFLTNVVVILDHISYGVLGSVPLFAYSDRAMFIYAYWNTQRYFINKYGITIFAPVFLIVFITSIVLCAILWVNVHKRHKTRFNSTAFKRATTTTLLITTTFLFTYSLRYFVSISQTLCLSCESRHTIAGIGTSTIFLGCAIDPLIFLCRSSNIRHELSALVTETTLKMESVAHPSEILSAARDMFSRPQSPESESRVVPIIPTSPDSTNKYLICDMYLQILRRDPTLCDSDVIRSPNFGRLQIPDQIRSRNSLDKIPTTIIECTEV